MGHATFLQIIPLVLSVIAIGTTITLWLLGRNSKGLGYEVLSIEPLFEKKSEAADRLEIRFDGNVVLDPHLVRVRVCNAERGALSTKDFRRPITISFGDAGVMQFTAPVCEPRSLSPSFLWEVNEVSIRALSLNAGATIVITVLAARKLDPSEVTCTTLIDGAVNAGEARRLNVGPPVLMQYVGTVLKWFWYVALAGGAVLMIWAFGAGIFQSGILKGLLGLLLLCGGIGAEILLIVCLKFVLDRSKWPYFMR